MISIAFFGDVCLQHKDLIEKSWAGLEAFHPTVRRFIQGVDFTFATLENPLFHNEATRNKEKLVLHASPKTVGFLKALKVKAVTLANNHIADYGAPCGLATIDLLAQESIGSFGAGYAGREGNPLIFETQGISFACIGYTHPPCEQWTATSNRFGSAPYHATEFKLLVESLKKRVNHILVFMHWGLEEINFPVPENVKTGREIINMGADLVIGSHPHVYQGYEQYKGKYIFYSLGNFIFGDIIAPTINNGVFKKKQSLRNRTALVPVFKISRDRIELESTNFFYFNKNNTLTKLQGTSARLNHFFLAKMSAAIQPDLSGYQNWWNRNIKRILFLKYLETAILKKTYLRLGKRHLGILKKSITKDVLMAGKPPR